MTIATSVLGIVPGLQATALLAHNVKFAKDSMKMKPNKKLAPKKIVKMGVTNLIGISMIKPTAQMINTP